MLLVDDHDDTLELMEMMLTRAGAEVRAANSVVEALAALGGFSADVVVTDISMPGRDGFDLLRHLRQLEGGIRLTPAVAFTAHAEESMKVRALAAGFALVVAMPADPDELVRGIASVCVR